MNNSNAIGGGGFDSSSPLNTQSDNLSTNNELRAPVPNRFSVLTNTTSPASENLNLVTHSNASELPLFAFSPISENEQQGFSNRIISEESINETPQNSLTSHESSGTLASSVSISGELDSLAVSNSTPQFFQNSDDSITAPDHLSDGTPPTIEASNIEVPVPGAPSPVVTAPIDDETERGKFFRNAFSHALRQAYQGEATNDLNETQASAIRSVLSSACHNQDISGIAVHALLITRLRKFCHHIEEIITGDPYNERSLHHAFSTAIETAYIEVVRVGGSPVGAARNAIKAAQEYVSPENAAHPIPIFNELIAPESSVHDWFMGVSDVIPYVLEGRLNQADSASSASNSSTSSSSPDRRTKLLSLYTMALTLFFKDVRTCFDVNVGDTRPPFYFNRLFTQMAMETVRFEAEQQEEKIKDFIPSATDTIKTVTDILTSGLREVALELTDLSATRGNSVPLVEVEGLNQEHSFVAAADFIAPQENTVPALGDEFGIAEPIIEPNFEDPDEPGELIPSRFEGEVEEG